MTSLRDLFDALRAGSVDDPAGLLRTHGFDLGEAEVAEALVTYAHTAPVEVAADLAPYVMAHSPVPVLPEGAPPDGLALLAGAGGAVDALDHLPDAPADVDPDPVGAPGGDGVAGDDPADLDFGAGGVPGAALARPDPVDEAATQPGVSVDGPTVDDLTLPPVDDPSVPVDDGAPGADAPWLDGFGSGAAGHGPAAPEFDDPEPPGL